MAQAAAARDLDKAGAIPIADPQHGMPAGFGQGRLGELLFWIAIAFSAFQITVSMYAFLPAQVIRAMHVGFLVLVGAALLANHKATSVQGRAFGWMLGLTGFAIGLYQWLFYNDILLRTGDLNRMDLIVGIMALATLFYVTWRFMGPSLPIIALLFLAYCLIGHLLPSPLRHRGYDLEQVIEHMSFGTEGIYATPTGVSSTFIFLFILFGSFLERAGMIKLFTDVSMGLVGDSRGGPGKVSVISSGLMGTISGSGVANVVSTGQFTIPLMKRFGYRPAFAGGVEATSSMGGQIMPPVMGAVAFIMAETIGVDYVEIVKAAIIPALLYYSSAFWAVHLEACKRGLSGLPREELPSAVRAIREKWFLILPLATLVYLLFSGYTPLFAGSVGLALTVVLLLGGSIALGLPNVALRAIFWIGLGIACAGFFAGRIEIAGLTLKGVDIIVAIVAVLVLANLFIRGGRDTLLMCRDALADGARQAVPVGIACATVGIVIGTMTLTGAGTSFGNFVISVGEDSLFLALVLTMIVSLLLGMGIPTIPNYIITSSLAAPVLLELGVPLIISHMFVFYFGIMADLTPPVALAAFAAAPIARENAFKIGWQAIRIALPGFVVPYMAIYDPALMLQAGGEIAKAYGYWVEVAYMVSKAGLAIMLWGAASIGYLMRPMAWPERALATVAAAFLVLALPVTDGIGFAAAMAFLLQHWWRARRAASTRAEAA